MKTSSARAPVKRSQAMNCLLVNQFATPGLGSLMAKRTAEGLVQLSLAVLGFLLVMGWFVQLFLNTYRMATNQPEQSGAYSHIGLIGTILFVASWLLSWITSLSLLREAKQNPEPPVVTPAKSARPQPPILKN